MRVTDMKLLTGKTETISISDFRARPGDVLLQVQMGKTYEITKCGKVVAVLAPPEPNAFELGAEARRIEAHTTELSDRERRAVRWSELLATR